MFLFLPGRISNYTYVSAWKCFCLDIEVVSHLFPPESNGFLWNYPSIEMKPYPGIKNRSAVSTITTDHGEEKIETNFWTDFQ